MGFTARDLIISKGAQATFGRILELYENDNFRSFLPMSFFEVNSAYHGSIALSKALVESEEVLE